MRYPHYGTDPTQRARYKHKKAGQTGLFPPCLPLHQPSIFPGYSSKRTNSHDLPEKPEKNIFSYFAGEFRPLEKFERAEGFAQSPFSTPR
jgi:hypothetical protein